MKDKVMILGEPWKIRRMKEKEDVHLKNCNGYTDFTIKTIVVEKTKNEPEDSLNNLREFEKKVLRHEIIHAFLIMCGLDCNSLEYESGWARNEEMVDWFAFMGPKIYTAWEEAEAL